MAVFEECHLSQMVTSGARQRAAEPHCLESGATAVKVRAASCFKSLVGAEGECRGPDGWTRAHSHPQIPAHSCAARDRTSPLRQHGREGSLRSVDGMALVTVP